MIIETQLVIIESELMIYFRMQEKMCFDEGFSCLYAEVCYYWNGCGIATFRVWMRLPVSL